MIDTTPKSLTDVLDAPEREGNFELYTKGAIYFFSFLGTVIFGAALLSKNLRTTGNTKPITIVWLVTAGYIILQILAIIYVKSHISTSLTFGLTVAGGLIMSKVLYPMYIPNTVHYKKKPIWKPLIILVVFLGLMIFVNVYSR